MREQEFEGGVSWGEGEISVEILVNFLGFFFPTYGDDIGHKTLNVNIDSRIESRGCLGGSVS